MKLSLAIDCIYLIVKAIVLTRTSSYIFAVEKKDGTTEYICQLGAKLGATNASPARLTKSPGEATQFPLTADKGEMIAWMNVASQQVTRWARNGTMRPMIFETLLTDYDSEDHEWQKALQRSGVAKLSQMEILALGIEKYEIERKMAED